MSDKESNSILTGQLVLLRHPIESDRDEFVALRQASREHLEKWEPIMPDADPFGVGCFDREIENHNTEREQRWVIIENTTGKIAGRITLGNIERGPFNNGRFGYWLGSGFEGKGYMFEALTLAVGHAFASRDDGGLGLHRVCANIVPSNERSRALLERVGFVKEGYSEKYLQIRGVYEDHERWAMTAEMMNES
ncbi:30S ribosomal protein S5 alanine N-acetyltransferase [bacterium]|nr:MAG: 30S ribosomal protein S5 alanine N-acetyltransferase [bacterium]